MHYRVTIQDAVEAHEILIEEFGGRGGILTMDALQSALGRPYHGYYRQIYKKGAALVESLVRNHGFVDANKRTAAALLLLLLERSGYDICPVHPNDDLPLELENLVVRVAQNDASFDDLADWLKPRCRKIVPYGG